jgi:hypothetical protein
LDAIDGGRAGTERRDRRQAVGSIAVVAILRDEQRFVEEWIAYHRVIGVDRFFLYDHDPSRPLRSLLHAHESYVAVVDWSGDLSALPGTTAQLKAYTHALGLLPSDCSWVAFIDGDEFIVLRRHARLGEFLAGFDRFATVVLNWHSFGHNGYYDDPPGLITASLTRRRAAPSPRTKTITRPEAIASISSAHGCVLRFPGLPADANGRIYRKFLYPGKTDVAHVNHYGCRSFRRFMARVERGDVSFSKETPDLPAEHRWRLDEELCLRQFVQSIAKDHNEMLDDYLLRYESAIRAHMAG